MYISEKTASQIIAEINKVIPYSINIMNPEGIIIASTDKNRLRQYHKGAHYLIQNKLPELRIREDDAFDNGRVGTNFPIVVRQTIIGVIGITGVYEEIHPYAQIIKRMTEILVLNEWMNHEQQERIYRRNQFLYEWIHASDLQDMEEMRERGLLLGVDIRVPRRFIAMQSARPLDEKTMQAYAQRLKQRLCTTKDSFLLVLSSRFLIGVPHCDDAALQAWLSNAWDVICDGSVFYAGIDSEGDTDSHTSYKKALLALRSSRVYQRDITFYKDMMLEPLLEEVTSYSKQKLLQELFFDYDEKERKEVIRLLSCYFEHDGSIQATSEALFIHKNTLQNRLRSIYARTGHDPRSLQNAALFQIAVQIERYWEYG